ncbi:MAG: glyoxylase-like metal-dependent hydrolase (beta-lactamase superfamily II) [Granulosicoccus sp.]|jgi:glyoxylase-like metal-dependent hydrolase (beta-lactamase superfamily II)
MKATIQSRREFLQTSAAIAGVVLLPTSPFSIASTQSPVTSIPFGSGNFYSLSDGQLHLPVSMVLSETLTAEERAQFIGRPSIGQEQYTPDCNVVLWKTPDRVILFDAGAGSQFPVGGGELATSLEQAGIDPYEITDVVFTHAHPDHLWGVLDDFDDLAFPDAQFHIARQEWNYWLDSKTMGRTDDARKSFVVGAQNRLPLLKEQVSLFNHGEEILPGIEAVATFGHTPGHMSFMLHSGTDSLLVVGDAIANAVVSFEYPSWPSVSDQNQALGVSTRLALLDRLSQDKSVLVGYHLPAPGIGYVERDGKTYRFVAK